MNQVHEKTFCWMSKLWKAEFIHDRVQLPRDFDAWKELDCL